MSALPTTEAHLPPSSAHASPSETSSLRSAFPNRRPLVLSAEQVRGLKPLIRRVEYYQPLYGLEIAATPLRPCEDRAKAIEAELPTGKKLRIIDMGCSLGYFALYFGDRGHQTQGIDQSEASVAVARAVGILNGLPSRFYRGELSLEFAEAIRPGEYDAVFLLSIMHHVIHARGLAYAQGLVAELVRRIPLVIAETGASGGTRGFRSGGKPCRTTPWIFFRRAGQSCRGDSCWVSFRRIFRR